MNQPNIWVWMIYQMETRAIVGGVRRCERAYWTDDEARAQVNQTAEEMRLGAVHWDEVDERTWIGRSDLDYVAVVTSVQLPPGEPPE